jgi:hypothetical protein
MTDNGGAMIAEEFTEGLQRLGIVHEKTLPYSPRPSGWTAIRTAGNSSRRPSGSSRDCCCWTR